MNSDKTTIQRDPQLALFDTRRKRPPAFHNTIPLSGEDLLLSILKAENQESDIIKIFVRGGSFTPPQIQLQLNRQHQKDFPLTSIRRAITNLTALGILEKTGDLSPGIYGKQNNVWKLKTH